MFGRSTVRTASRRRPSSLVDRKLGSASHALSARDNKTTARSGKTARPSCTDRQMTLTPSGYGAEMAVAPNDGLSHAHGKQL